MAPKKSHCVLDDWTRDSLSSTIHTYHKCRALEKHHSYYSSSCFLTNIIGSRTSCGILLCARFLALKLMVVSKEKSLLIECLGRPWRKAQESFKNIKICQQVYEFYKQEWSNESHFSWYYSKSKKFGAEFKMRFFTFICTIAQQCSKIWKLCNSANKYL